MGKTIRKITEPRIPTAPGTIVHKQKEDKYYTNTENFCFKCGELIHDCACKPVRTSLPCCEVEIVLPWNETTHKVRCGAASIAKWEFPDGKILHVCEEHDKDLADQEEDYEG